jgi:hypothetical protein
MKFCIFCGKPPTDKNKEHVIPRWLIELTGDPKRTVRLGFNMQPGSDPSHREYAFDQFTFPACEVCNSRFSSLEARTKSTITRLLAHEPVSATELSSLMDWFDKVRVGLWLGFQLLNKNILDIDPNFHIETRIGQFDRLLCIERYKTTATRLNFAGTDTPAFAYMPSAFTLTVNDLQFTNLSYTGLVSRRLGFPYPSELALVPDQEGLLHTILPPRRRIMRPVVQRAAREKGVFFYQPMFPQGLTTEPSTLYNDDYVRANSLNFQLGIGAVFIEEPGRGPRRLDNDDSVSIEPPCVYEAEEQLIRSAIEVCNWQDWLIQTGCTMDRLTPEQRRYVRSKMSLALRVNGILREHHSSMLSKRGYGA